MRHIRIHDINNKLTAIDGYTVMLLDTSLTEAQLKYVKEIRDSSNEAIALFKQEIGE